jgi:hypothetical protein
LRIELLMSLLAGFAGGLVGTLWNGLVSPALLSRVRAGDRQAWHDDSSARLFAGALLYGTGGAVLGFLFWLGWGLIALVGKPWPGVGVLFGLLCWVGAAVPALGMLHLRLREPKRIAAVLALEWLVACLAIGLLCALTWHRVA